MSIRWIIWVGVALLLAGCAAGPAENAGGAPEPLLVAAAADLQTAFTELGQTFEQQTGQPVRFSFGSTGKLTTQIENGAPFDILAAANESYIDRLAAGGYIIPGSQQLYAQGQLVLVVNRESGVQATVLQDLLDSNIARVAIANPAHAPYGQAAQEALQSAGLWGVVQPKLVLGENVRQTLQFVQTGDAPVGIVARSIADVPEVSYTPLPANLYPPLKQALAITKTSTRPEAARQFVEFISSPQGRSIMQKHGFLLPGEFK
ncbi:MAG: molybdate ABC transporter substrate-binding protein [Chloroflexi bacterium]|nr:MAG: molybdate ABC transporter substrate-binding protein [Chloroflexota bacterium]